MKGFFEWLDRFLEEFVHGDRVTIDHTLEAPISPVDAIKPILMPTPPNPDILVPWGDQKANYHNVRVLCDLAGLTFAEKNLICACLYQESQFFNTVKGVNKNSEGKVMSTDFGLCQINDYYHIGKGKDFPSVQYVLDNPGKVVNWMIGMYQKGQLGQWVSFSSGAYKMWLRPNSPMWFLKS